MILSQGVPWVRYITYILTCHIFNLWLVYLGVDPIMSPDLSIFCSSAMNFFYFNTELVALASKRQEAQPNNLVPQKLHYSHKTPSSSVWESHIFQASFSGLVTRLAHVGWFPLFPHYNFSQVLLRSSSHSYNHKNVSTTIYQQEPLSREGEKLLDSHHAEAAVRLVELRVSKNPSYTHSLLHHTSNLHTMTFSYLYPQTMELWYAAAGG